MPLRVNKAKTKKSLRALFVIFGLKNGIPISLLLRTLSEQACRIHILNELLDFGFLARLNGDGINVLNRRIILNIHQGQSFFIECDTLFQTLWVLPRDYEIRII